MKQFFKRLAN